MLEDKDLEFLKECSHEDLDNLVHLLIYDKDGKKRISEKLSTSEAYKKHYPKHLLYYQEVISEFQCYGGNTIANTLRGGKGVPYREILEDVCTNNKIKYDKTIDTESLEKLLMLTVIEHSLEKMNDEQRKELLLTLNIKSTDLTNQTIMIAIQTAARSSGFGTYRLSVIVANAVVKQLTGKGISLVGNQVLTKSISALSGPVGWAITSLWTIYDIAGPAYRVTIPAVLEIAYLRQNLKEKQRTIWYKPWQKLKTIF